MSIFSDITNDFEDDDFDDDDFPIEDLFAPSFEERILESMGNSPAGYEEEQSIWRELLCRG